MASLVADVRAGWSNGRQLCTKVIKTKAAAWMKDQRSQAKKCVLRMHDSGTGGYVQPGNMSTVRFLATCARIGSEKDRVREAHAKLAADHRSLEKKFASKFGQGGFRHFQDNFVSIEYFFHLLPFTSPCGVYVSYLTIRLPEVSYYLKNWY